ncbi:MAG: iron-sulfur cluster insertion protein ErpA [Candidatus Nucleicultricaceae bacterium]
MSHNTAPEHLDLIPDTPDIQGHLKISKSAVQQLKSLAKKDEIETIALRVLVLGGGCYGMQYRFEFDSTKKEEEIVFQFENIHIFIDDVSLNFLNDSVIDFREDLMGAAFVISNPNAVSSCGCGNSFSVM